MNKMKLAVRTGVFISKFPEQEICVCVFTGNTYPLEMKFNFELGIEKTKCDGFSLYSKLQDKDYSSFSKEENKKIMHILEKVKRRIYDLNLPDMDNKEIANLCNEVSVKKYH